MRRRLPALLLTLLLFVSAGVAACGEATESQLDKIVDQVEPVQLQESSCRTFIGKVALSPEAAAYAPPAQVPVYRITPTAPVTRESMDALADQFGFGPDREYGEDWLAGSGGRLTFPRADDAGCYRLDGGGGEPGVLLMSPDDLEAEAAGLPAASPEETRTIAAAFLDQWGVGDHLTFLETFEASAYGTATPNGEEERWVVDMGARYRAYVNGIPLVGPGSQVSMRVNPYLRVFDFAHFAEQAVESEYAVTIRPLEAALEDLKVCGGEGPTDLTSEQATSITVEGAEICYYAPPAGSAEMYYKPVYVLHVRLSDGTLRDWTLSAFEGRVGEGASSTLSPSSVWTSQGFTVEWAETATVLNGARLVASPPQVDPEATPTTPGNVVVYCVVEITNGTDGPFSYDEADFMLNAKNEAWAGGYGGLTAVSEPPLLSGTLQPGETVRGAVPFEFSPEEIATAMNLRYYRCHETPSMTVNVMGEWQGEY